MKKIVLGGGCFWCLDPIFQKLDGVQNVVVGYAGGSEKNPSYREVAYGKTGHAEVLEITYDPNIVCLTKILQVFFSLHDPTTLNRQGVDKGTQYRSIILYNTNDEKDLIQQIIQNLDVS